MKGMWYIMTVKTPCASCGLNALPLPLPVLHFAGVPKITISPRSKETDTEVALLMPTVKRLQGKQPALRIVNGFNFSNSGSSSGVAGTSMLCMKGAW